MQQQTNSSTDEMIRTGGYHAARRAMSGAPAIVALSASAIVSFFFLIRLVLSAATSRLDAILTCLYYFCGVENAMIINLAAGIPLLAFFIFTSFSLGCTIIASRKDNRAEVHSGTGMVNGAMIFGIVLSLLYTVVALCSVSVMYQSYRLNLDNAFLSVDGSNYSDLFFLTIVFATVCIAFLVAWLRFSITLRHAADCTRISSSGCIFALVASSVAAVSFLMLFFGALVRLVMPAENASISISYVGTAACDVLFTAGLTLVFSAAIFVVAGFYSQVSSITRMSSYNYIYQFTTNNFPRRNPSPTGTPPTIKGEKYQPKEENKTSSDSKPDKAIFE